MSDPTLPSEEELAELEGEAIANQYRTLAIDVEVYTLLSLIAAARAVRRVEAECERIINATAPHRDDCCAGCVHTEATRIKAALTGAKP